MKFAMADSIFTKIIKGEIPCFKIYEDERTLAFLDIHPSVEGHTLVIPKKQVEFVWDLEPDDYVALMDSVKKVADHLRRVTHKEFVGSKIIGIDVPHAHVHLVPFSTIEEYRRAGDQSAEPDFAALKKVHEKLTMIAGPRND